MISILRKYGSVIRSRIYKSGSVVWSRIHRSAAARNLNFPAADETKICLRPVDAHRRGQLQGGSDGQTEAYEEAVLFQHFVYMSTYSLLKYDRVSVTPNVHVEEEKIVWRDFADT